VNDYRKELERWENEQTRQFEEFIIDEDELKERLVIFLFYFQTYSI
jgi:hypothetical protein